MRLVDSFRNILIIYKKNNKVQYDRLILIGIKYE
jgi:hypothetical protein